MFKVTKIDGINSQTVQPYIALPETYIGNQLTSYGGFIKFKITPHSSRPQYRTEEAAADIIIIVRFFLYIYYTYIYFQFDLSVCIL